MYEQDKLLDQTSITHLFPITKYLGLLATGMTGIFFFVVWIFMQIISETGRMKLITQFNEISFESCGIHSVVKSLGLKSIDIPHSPRL